MQLAAELSGDSRREQHQAADGKAFQLPPERMGGGRSPRREVLGLGPRAEASATVRAKLEEQCCEAGAPSAYGLPGCCGGY